ncbi:hypothetical protein ACW7N6_38170 [Streptomyces sp. UC1A3]
MTGRLKFGYVYGGTATIRGATRVLDGTAWSLGRCDEVRLRAAAVRDLSRSEGVPLAGIEITDFWYSEIVEKASDRDLALGAESADPFRPQHPCAGPDPFRPCAGPDGGDA